MKMVTAWRPFAALWQRSYRLLWTQSVLEGTAQQMEMVVLGWFVLQLTNSPFMVGLITSARWAANALAGLSGSIADRMSRKLIIAGVLTVLATLALIMLALILSGVLQIWHIFVITLLGSVARIFEAPARQALVADILDEDELSNGIALSNAGMNLTRILGSIAGGFLFRLVGPEGAFGFMAFLYALGLLVILFLKVEPMAVAVIRESVWRSMLQGMGHVRHHKVLLAALVMAAIANLTAFPLNFTLMPVFARDVLGTDSAGLGVLLSGFGIGALVGSLIIASVPRMRGTGRLLVIAMISWHALIVVFALSDVFRLSLTIIFVIGAAQAAAMAFIAILLLSIAAPEFRGRIMGLRSLAVYPLLFGSLISGALADAFGAPAAAVVNAAAGGLLILVLALWLPNLYRGQAHRQL